MSTILPDWDWNTATQRPDQHCFREDNCAEHPDHTSIACCCCGWLADSHTGCDCD